MTHRPGSARIGRWKHALAGGAVVVCLLAAVDVAAAQRVTFERVGVVGFVEVPVDGYRRWGGLAMGSGVTSGYYVYASDAYAYRYFPRRHYPVRSYTDCGWQWRLTPRVSAISGCWFEAASLAKPRGRDKKRGTTDVAPPHVSPTLVTIGTAS